MKTILARIRLLFPVAVLLLVLGCATYNPGPGVGCAKFMSDYTEYERITCSGD